MTARVLAVSAGEASRSPRSTSDSDSRNEVWCSKSADQEVASESSRSLISACTSDDSGRVCPGPVVELDHSPL